MDVIFSRYFSMQNGTNDTQKYVFYINVGNTFCREDKLLLWYACTFAEMNTQVQRRNC